ncbi:hypothetical protein [Nonomuraea sp. NPDC002799]
MADHFPELLVSIHSRTYGKEGVEMGEIPPFGGTDTSARPKICWLEPYPDVLLNEIADHLPGPEARYEVRESLSAGAPDCG